jgi:uncharacterized membrane protein YraQ (UPF0718 family)
VPGAVSTVESPPVRSAGPPPARRVPLWLVSVVGWTVVIGLLVARHSLVADSAAITTFGIIFASIVVEALPFILLGAVVAAAMAVYVPDRAFGRVAALPRWLQVPGGALAGLAFPLCECGSVPVGRRLVGRGIEPAAGLAFMLAAPLVNPIVILSTWVAFGGGRRGAEMVAGRCGFGLLLAMAVALAASRGRAEDLQARCAAGGGGDEHDHAHLGRGERHGHFISHVVGDFLAMGAFLVLGAALSAGLQTAVPQDLISGLAGSLVLAPLALMALAFMLCLCSEADAFVAISFTAFPRAAQLAFLLLGPVLDLKLSVLYSATFGVRFAVRVALVAVPLVLAGALLFGAVTG